MLLGLLIWLIKWPADAVLKIGWSNLFEYLGVDPVPGISDGNLWMTSPQWYLATGTNWLFVSALTTCFAVYWHRRFLKSDVRESVWTAFRWRRRHSQFFVFFLILDLIVGLANLLPTVGITFLFSHLYIAGILDFGGDVFGRGIQFFHLQILVWMMVGAIISAAILARVAIMFPSIAVNRKLTRKAVFWLTRSNGVRIFWILSVSYLPIFLLVGTLGSLILLASTSKGALLIFVFVRQVLGFLFLAISITFVSIVYRKLAGSSTGIDNLSRGG